MTADMEMAAQATNHAHQRDLSRANNDVEPIVANRDVPTRPKTFVHAMWHNWPDWILLFLLGAGILITERVITPHHMYLTEYELMKLKYPTKDHTVPTWAVPIVSVVGPVVVMTCHGTYLRTSVALHHSAILGAMLSMVLSGFMTNVLKIQVRLLSWEGCSIGRPRPDFFYRCFPDGIPAFMEGKVPGIRYVNCHSIDKRTLEDGYRSFPSGHTSWTFASMGFTSLYLFYFMIPGQRPTSYAFMGTIAFPLLLAAWIGATRVADYDHHGSDVIAGAILGSMCAMLMFAWRFPWTIRTYHSRHFEPVDRRWHEIDEAHMAEADTLGALLHSTLPSELLQRRSTLPPGEMHHRMYSSSDMGTLGSVAVLRHVANDAHEALPPGLNGEASGPARKTSSPLAPLEGAPPPRLGPPPPPPPCKALILPDGTFETAASEPLENSPQSEPPQGSSSEREDGSSSNHTVIVTNEQ